MVIVPHPDDEALLAAGLIHRAATANIHISVALVTNGDYLCADHSKGAARLSESLSALQKLGVKSDNIFFMGYPDTGYELEVSFLNGIRHAEDENLIFPSSCSAETYALPTDREDYAYLRTGKHSTYSRSGFENDLNALLEEISPQLVVTTSEWDQHGDHAALSYFIRKALGRSSDRPVLWEGIVHSPAGDLIWPIPNTPSELFTMPPGLEQDTLLKWSDRISLPVPADCSKSHIILEYKTALSPDEPEVVSYLLSFAKADEIFWETKY